MAIKIKNKSKKSNEELDETVEVEAEEASEGGLEREIEANIVDEPDPFQRTAVESVEWASKHTSTVIVAVVLLVIIGASSYFLLSYLESRKETMSSELNPVFQANSYLIKGSEEYKAVEEAKPDFEVKTFDSEKQREEVILKAAVEVTRDASGESIEIAALLAEASAQLKLGETEQAEGHYRTIINKAIDTNVQTMARYGLIEALVEQKKYDEALATLGQIEEKEEGLTKGLRYTKARLLQDAGKIEEAKKLYTEILDENAAGAARQDIERRLANL